MKSFWINVAAALFVSVIFGGPTGNWARKRINAYVAAAERGAAAEIRIAEALERAHPPARPKSGGIHSYRLTTTDGMHWAGSCSEPQ